MNERQELKAAIREQEATEESRKRAQAALDASEAYLGKLERERAELKARSDGESERHGMRLLDAFRAGRNAELIVHSNGLAAELVALDGRVDAASQARDALDAELSAATDRVTAGKAKVMRACAAVCVSESEEIVRQFVKADEMAIRLRAQLAGLPALRGAYTGLVLVSTETAGALHRTQLRYPESHSLVESAQAWREHIERLTSDPEHSLLNH